MRTYLCSTANEPLTNELVSIIDSAGHDAWPGQWVFSGPDAKEQVQSAIEQSDAFVYLLSKASVNSEQCRWEYHIARNYRLPVIVVQLEDDCTLPRFLDKHPPIDFSYGLAPQVVNVFVQTLSDIEALTPATHDSAHRSAADQKSAAFDLEARSTTILVATAITILLGLFAGITISATGQQMTEPTAGLLWAFSAPYQFFNPLWLFIACALFFTLVYRHKVALPFLLGIHISLVGGYLTTADTSFWYHLLMILASIGGYLLGESRILLWPWLSVNLNWQHNQVKELLEQGTPVQDCATPLLEAIAEPVVYPPYGLEAALKTLGEAGLTTTMFEPYATDKSRREQYFHITKQIGIRRLQEVDNLPRALELVETFQLLPVAYIAWPRITMEKLDRATTQIERQRVLGRFIGQAKQLGRPSVYVEDNAQSFEQTAALVIDNLIISQIDPFSTDHYWRAYDKLNESVTEVIRIFDEDPCEMGPREAIHHNLQKLEATSKARNDISAWTTHVRYPQAEVELQAALAEVEINTDEYLTTDYHERQNHLGQKIMHLQMLGDGQPGSWKTIDPEGQYEPEHTNPWCLYIFFYLQHLEKLKALDTLYVASVEQAVLDILHSIATMDDLSELHRRLARVSRDTNSFGTRLDHIIESLQRISLATEAGLEQPLAAYAHRDFVHQALSEAQLLNTHLNARYTSREAIGFITFIKDIITLLDTHLNDIRKVESLPYRNPYIVGKPIKSHSTKLFKGRANQVRQLVEHIAAGGDMTLLIHGPRRIGKTSFLIQLQNMLSIRHEPIIPVFLDGQGSGADESDACFYFALAYEIYRKMRIITSKKIERPTRECYGDFPRQIFEPWLDEHIIPLLEDRKLLITIDEFEKIGKALHSNKLTTKVLDFLRHNMQHSEHLIFLFSGVSLKAFGPEAASFFIGTEAIEIGFLTDEAAKELIVDPNPDISRGLPHYSNDAVEEILYLTHNHPFLIQAICSKLVDMANPSRLDAINVDHVYAVLPDVFTAQAAFFEFIWTSTNKAGREILSILATDPEALTDNHRYKLEMKELGAQNIISKSDGNKFHITIPLIEQWIQVVKKNRSTTITT